MKVFKRVILYKIILIISLCVGYLINLFVSNNFVFEFKISKDILLSYKTYLYAFECFAFVMLFFIFVWYKKLGKNPKKLMSTTEKDIIYTGLEQAHFQTDEEIKNNFKIASYNMLPQVDIEGIPVKAEETKKGYDITFSKPAHTLIIGTTGSGKTTTFINPTIQILSNTRIKPSMLISDPKGELYSLHAKSLIKKGYDVKVLDLRNPYCSIRWNPLEKPFEMYQEMLSLDDKVRVNEEEGYYIFEDKIYYDKEELQSTIQVKKQEIFDEVYEDLNDICSVLCPIKNKSEPIWESGAKNFILAITLAMLEDSENPELGMTKEKFNFYNVMKIATNTQDDCEELIQYFNHRSPISKSVSLSKQVLDASDKTRGSYLSTVFDKLSLFSDMSICSLTSANEIDFGVIVDKPTALFLQIPDEKETRHTLAAMVILQAYKALVAKANTYPDLSLPRSVYFLLDEFGNLPQIHKLEQMITVGRSRKIWLALVVQSYAQLAKVYDEKSADIIKSNCNIQIFIGTTDQKTIEEFSKKCGNYSIIQKNVSFSSSNDGVGSSVSVKERPLIYPTELAQLNNNQDMGNVIVSIFGYSPIRSKFTPSFKSRFFVLEKTNQLLAEGKYFNEEKVFYNMLKRNEKFNKKVNRRSETQTISDTIEKFKINLSNADFESIGCFEQKEAIQKFLEKEDFREVSRILEDVYIKAKNQEFENIEFIADLKSMSENLVRLTR